MRKDVSALGTATLGGMLLALILVAGAAQAAPKFQAQPQLQVQPPQLSTYHYTAETNATVRKQGKVDAGGIQWQCQDKRCTVSGPWPEPGVTACKALAAQVGRISRYGHPGKQLDAKGLQACNAGLATKPTPAKPVQQITKPSQPIAPQAQGMGQGMAPGMQNAPSLPQAGNPQGLPAAGMPGGSATPGAGFGQTPPPGAADEIREAAAGLRTRPRIDSLIGEPGQRCAQRRLTVRGSNFGDSAGSRRLMFMTPTRLTPVSEARYIDRWSDTEIATSLPSATELERGRRYVVAIVDASGHALSNTTREIYICPTQVVIEGDIRVEHCAAGPSNIRINAYSGATRIGTTLAEGVPGNDFAMRYEMRLPASRNMELELRPELSGFTCTGGAWTPERVPVNVGFDRARAEQDFAFRVGMAERRIPMTVVAGLVANAFRGTEIRINNYNSATGRVRENDSYVRLSEALGGSERRFNIGPAVTGPRKYYINDINLATTSVRASGGELKVTLAFETNGMELIGTCGQDGFDAGCIAGAPDVQANIAVDIYFTLDRYYSRAAPVSLSFSRVRVAPNVQAQADGLCLALDFLCTMITDYRATISSIIESSFLAVLDTTAVRDEIAIALLPALADLRIGTLNSVRVDGGNLVLTYLEDLE